MQENEFETLEAELAQSRADLKLAFKRIADLQAALEEELDSDEDSFNLDDRYITHTSFPLCCLLLWGGGGDQAILGHGKSYDVTKTIMISYWWQSLS